MPLNAYRRPTRLSDQGHNSKDTNNNILPTDYFCSRVIMLVVRSVVIIYYYYSSLISCSAEYARLFRTQHTPSLGKTRGQQNQGLSYIRQQTQEHVFPTVRYLHLLPKAKRYWSALFSSIGGTLLSFVLHPNTYEK
jgi:hypothetical protein